MTNAFEDIDGWTPTGAESDHLISSCAGSRLYGGFGIFGANAAATKVLP